MDSHEKKKQVLFSQKKTMKKLFLNAVSCSRDWHFKVKVNEYSSICS